MDQRAKDAVRIKKAYLDAEKALRNVGKILRTTEAGKYMWASDHKLAVTGLRIALQKLRNDVPDYK